jgi:hypothetical protein
MWCRVVTNVSGERTVSDFSVSTSRKQVVSKVILAANFLFYYNTNLKMEAVRSSES